MNQEWLGERPRNSGHPPKRRGALPGVGHGPRVLRTTNRETIRWSASTQKEPEGMNVFHICLATLGK